MNYESAGIVGDESMPLSRFAPSILAALILGGMNLGVALAASAQTTASAEAFAARLTEAAIARTKARVIYDPAYRKLSYPGGDVPLDRGVCSDVVVRSYRALGIDLQKLVHEDMRRSFRSYPRRWGLRRPDRNIDHRRVPNLRTYFKRHGKALVPSADGNSYQPGDLVTWDIAKPFKAVELQGRLSLRKGRQRFAQTPHIGIVSSKRSADGQRPLIVHNIGWGTRLEDMLFNFRITGHYRFQPDVGS